MYVYISTWIIDIMSILILICSTAKSVSARSCQHSSLRCMRACGSALASTMLARSLHRCVACMSAAALILRCVVVCKQHGRASVGVSVGGMPKSSCARIHRCAACRGCNSAYVCLCVCVCVCVCVCMHAGGVTSGLKKVSKEEMTHKNPQLRASSVVPAKASGVCKKRM